MCCLSGRALRSLSGRALRSLFHLWVICRRPCRRRRASLLGVASSDAQAAHLEQKQHLSLVNRLGARDHRSQLNAAFSSLRKLHARSGVVRKRKPRALSSVHTASASGESSRLPGPREPPQRAPEEQPPLLSPPSQPPAPLSPVAPPPHHGHSQFLRSHWVLSQAYSGVW